MITKLVFLFCIFMYATPSATLFERYRALQAAHKNDWKEAQQQLNKAIVTCYDDPVLLYDAGVAAYQCQEFEQAANYFTQVIDSPSSSNTLREQALFNRGCVATKQQQFPDAIGFFEQVLQINPPNTNAQENIAYLKKLMEQQKQQEKKQEQQQNKNKNNDDKNQPSSDTPRNEQDSSSKQEPEQGEQKNNPTDDSRSEEKQETHPEDQSGQPKDDSSESEEKCNDDQKNRRQQDQERQQEQTGNEKQSAKQEQREQGGNQDDKEQQLEKEQKGKQQKHEETPGHKDTKKGDSSLKTKAKATGSQKESAGKGTAQQADEDRWLAEILDAQAAHDQKVSKQFLQQQMMKKGVRRGNKPSW